ncbi:MULTISPECIES: hypothetical protein [Alteromonadaceae]|jgi:uncharacterized membrane protein YgcG|uniref:Uncharacterized protein n=2 Tax=Paraglaciecola chathamensis TaxID=368405 RepID=A0ABQ0IAR6_9ALTE|nr:MULTISPECIES: hypothetical protein [Alteromonadaceae]MCQ8849831.1 hypothetical protein [Alteromonas stellipolaris]GAC06456.1 hypothetical protein GAGA_3623 [Paraglaciecola agarilytica NO2]GAC12000.1 hypothetical protein GCHA_4074 [Paraglaciecola chathamensis S18K6]
MVYLLAGIVCVHLAWAFFNTLAVNSTLFINNSSRAITLLVNWLIPIGGPAITLVVLRSINPKVKGRNPVADGSGSSNLYSGNEGSDSGGGCGD